MKISIITICFNSEDYIKTAIKSVLNQTYSDLEYVLVDGMSSDSTVSIIKEYEPLFAGKMKWVSERDKGLYDAMNKGINMATGDVIGILNSDDLYVDNNVLELVMSNFNKNPNLDMVFGDLIYVKQNDVNSTVRTWVSQPYFENFFERGNVPPHPSLFLRSRVYKKAGVFNLSYKLAADYEFMLRVFKKFNFSSIYLNNVLVKMRLGGATNKNFMNIFNGNKEILRSWNENGLRPPFLLMPLRVIKRIKQFFV